MNSAFNGNTAGTQSWGNVNLDPVAAVGTAAVGAPPFANTGTAASAASGFGAGNAIPTAQIVNFAQTLRSYNLTQTAIQSPTLSVNDLRFSLKRKEQLSNIFDILSENTSYAWQDRYRDEFVRLSQNKYVANIDSTGNLIRFTGELAQFDGTPGKTSGASTYSDAATDVGFNASGATILVGGNVVAGTGAATGSYLPGVGVPIPASTLTQGILDRCYMKLIRDGAGTNALGRENSRPVFGLICSSETSRNLIADNPDIRQDWRYSKEVNELLAPLGIERSYAGFFHMVDDWGPRYILTTVAAPTVSVTLGASNATALQYVRVFPYAMVATTQGYKWDINPAYEAATYEDSIVFHPDVFINLVPKPITSVGQASFDAVSYMGEFKWKNIPHQTDNPDGTLGFFRAVLSAGSKPVRPEWGFVIRHQRASTTLGLLNVTTASQNTTGVDTFNSIQANA